LDAGDDVTSEKGGIAHTTSDPTRFETVDEQEPGPPAVSSDAPTPPELRELVLEVRNFRSWFDTERGMVRAVDGVDLAVREGETMGVVGESGCGKTVLSRSIMGLLSSDNNVVRSGEVIFKGRNLLELERDEMRDVLGVEIAMIFQDPMTSLNPVMRVGKQIAEALRLHEKLSKAEARDVAIRLLRSVHIPEPERCLRQYPHQLSGGMRQRVMIAIALSCGPNLLLADEPTTALDVTVQAQILDLLEEQQAERKMAIVLVSHDLGVVATRTDQISVMYAGKIVETGPTISLFDETRMPYTEALLNSIPRLDEEHRVRLQAIAGRPPDLVNPPSGCRFAPRCAYAQDRCVEEEPPLRDAETPGHRFACWFPVGTLAGVEALNKNIERGVVLPEEQPTMEEAD
jgi:peptide/nickel transport system ATP-binding protein